MSDPQQKNEKAGASSQEEEEAKDCQLDQKYPNRPHNHSTTLPFHELFLNLFNPLNDIKKKPSGPGLLRRKQGPHGPASVSPHEARRGIIEKFISRWRKEVGNDILPAFRLIVPEKDQERPMYGLKEKAIAKILVKVLKLDKNSEDGFNLLNWKLPGQNAASRMAGDFAGRCYEVISKRPMLTKVGNMTIGEVNGFLDRLALAPKESGQTLIFEEFYRRMNAEEMMWLVRIILRQMKIGATERTIFDIWNPDAESLFSVSSSLRRVCWELHDPSIRLESEHRRIALMQCFQPQLAQFQVHSFAKIVERMFPTKEDPTFWIEEKMDGERMQLHMMNDDDTPGGKRFGFWSRKAKDYTYLYGSGFQDESAALTRHLRDAFHSGVHSIILDGEMITWDPEQDAALPFGTLKTAALSESRNPFSTGQRPLYRVFDCLFLNGEDLTQYTLRDRRKALEASVNSIRRRMEIQPFEEATDASAIEPHLRRVIAEASEGLVIKNPRSMYRLNERHDDWMKVKPEYMTGFGESLDCVIVGGYYGSGKRGGILGSFLCGLRVDQAQIDQGANPMKCYSFFKVGGGFSAEDYSSIRHHTEGKWKDWDVKRPPREFIELGGGDLQYERPDAWIKPDESVVISIKAASIQITDTFRMGMTLRFPRFKRLRLDRDWSSALSIQGWLDLKSNMEQQQKDQEFRIDNERKLKRARLQKKKRDIIVMGGEEVKNLYGGPESRLFDGSNFYVLTESTTAPKKTKIELEQLIKHHGGKLYQTNTAAPHTMCIADRRTVKVASVEKSGKDNIIRPAWIFDCISQAEKDDDRGSLLLPLEPRHMLFTLPSSEDVISQSVDAYNESFFRDVEVAEMRKILDGMSGTFDDDIGDDYVAEGLFEDLSSYRGRLFHSTRAFFDFDHLAKENGLNVQGPENEAQHIDLGMALEILRFGNGTVETDLCDLGDDSVTHIIVSEGHQSRVKQIRQILSQRDQLKLAHVVTASWVIESWKEKTLLDEDRFIPLNS